MAPVLYTIGHSTRSLREIADLLRANGVTQVADVRSIPKSRHCPQFHIDVLPGSLEQAGIAYAHLKELGGRRSTRKSSVNTGWRNASFRGYADYMGTPEFAAGLEKLIGMAKERPTAIMCAEAVPWRCHRSLVADAMTVRGWEVREIVGAAPPRLHMLTPFLRVIDGKLLYPAPEETP